ncbi:MAG: hypothetical protein HZA31_11425 [Opitutae bacterium]|nr:hypothetical protein [Opitutae bacterium]
MKHYIIDSTFVRPITEFRDLVPEHRSYLQMRIDDGVILYSGPKATRDGEVIVARAESDERIKELLDSEPYGKLGHAKYTIVSFTPTMKNPLLDRWV